MLESQCGSYVGVNIIRVIGVCELKLECEGEVLNIELWSGSVRIEVMGLEC